MKENVAPTIHSVVQDDQVERMVIGEYVFCRTIIVSVICDYYIKIIFYIILLLYILYLNSLSVILSFSVSCGYFIKLNSILSCIYPIYQTVYLSSSQLVLVLATIYNYILYYPVFILYLKQFICNSIN